MRVQLDLFRAADGRLEGVVHAPGDAGGPFAGVLDLLRVLEGIDIGRWPPDRDGTGRRQAGRDDIGQRPADHDGEATDQGGHDG